MWLGMVVLFTIFGIPLIIFSTLAGGQDAPPPAFTAIWIGIILWFWYVALVWISYEVRLSSAGEIEFRSVLRRTKTNAHDIRFIGSAAGGLDPYTILVRFNGKTARIIRQMDGFHDLIGTIRSFNPGVELRGV